MSLTVPYIDLAAQYRALREDIDGAIRGVIEDTAFIGGAPVRAFEQAYARAYGVAHCISCANGTDAITIALRMLGIGRGDEVITTALSWISSSEAISQTGAMPVFVDVADDLNIDVAAIEDAITPRTRAVLPVHLFGQAARMDAILDICKRRSLQLVEDCAQAHFATFGDRRVGTFGAAGTFSFYPSKNLGAFGDAGAIITNDDELATRCRMYANHGQLARLDHQIEGVNSRLDGLQAAILLAKLPHVHDWIRKRQAIAEQYTIDLREVPGLELPARVLHSSHVHNVFAMHVRERDRLRSHLTARGIETRVHYPAALPLLPAYRSRGATPAQFPRAHSSTSRALSLPVFPEMTADQVSYVIGSIREFYA